MNKRRWMLVALLAAVLLTGCQSGPPAWPGLTATDQIAYLASGPQVFAINVENGKELWHYPQSPNARDIFYAAPVLTPDGLVIVGSAGSDHSLIAIDPTRFPKEVPPPVSWFGGLLCSLGLSQTNCPVEVHAEAWKFSAAKDHWIASPLIVGDLLFAPNSDGNLYVLDLTDGVFQKTAVAVIPLGGHLWGSPITDGERVFVTSLDHMIFAVDAASLETLWSEDLGAAIPGSPVFGPDGMIYVTSFASKMERLDPATGEHAAIVETENWVWNGPTVAGETLYFGDVAGNFYSFDLPASQLTWTPIKLDDAITAGALVLDDQVLVATESGDVYEVDADGQSRIWSDAAGSVYTTPVMAGELILVAPTQANRYLSAFDRTGHLEWQFPPGE